MHTNKSNFFFSALPLFLVILIDGIGLGLITPVLTQMIISDGSSFLPQETSATYRYIIYDIIFSSFMFSWFFGAAFLGDLSDQIGRKKSLLICLAGTFVGYLLSAFSIITASVLIFILGRVIAGLTSGSQSIAQAAIIDLSTEEHKARNIGMMLFFASLGFILGPLIGGLFSNPAIIPWFNTITPFYIAAGLAFINILLLWKFFGETGENVQRIKIKWHRAIEIFVSAFRNERVRDLSIIFLVTMIGWASFYCFIGTFIMGIFSFNATQSAVYFALLAVGFGVGCSVILNLLLKRFHLKNVTLITLSLTSLFILLIAFTHSTILLWLLILPLGITISTAYTALITLFSNQVDPHEQGWVMGITGAIMAACFGLSALFIGLLNNFGNRAPIIFSGVVMGLSAYLMFHYAKRLISTTAAVCES